MKRRSLTNVGGEIETSGDADKAKILSEAIDVVPSPEEDAPDRAHVHGFHAYPARAHPDTVRRLIEALVPEKGTVLDPFCGSGTVLIEAMLAGRNAIGSDLNPIAVMLARAKTFPRPADKTAALLEAAKGVASVADARRKAKAGATTRLPPQDVAMFAPHVLLELDGLRAGIAEAAATYRPELGLILSSILVKVSQKRGDTSDDRVEKRIGAGYAAKLFVKKAEDLVRRLDELTNALPTPPPRARVYEDDATVLKKVEDASIDAIITSPPYVATYDYLTHHELRMRWLGLDSRALARSELGARRNYGKLTGEDAKAAWAHELSKLFRTLARVAKPGAPLVLLIADSAVGNTAIRADEAVAYVAKKTSFTPVARASQARQHFHDPTQRAFSDGPRLEHALLLTRNAARD